MPLINQSVAITNPMNVDRFSVNRRVQTVSNSGLASTTSTITTPVFGVVYPTNENDLKLFPDLRITEKCITVITRFALRATAETSTNPPVTFQPDIVVWPLPIGGNNFLVRGLLDWSQYGPGFVLAICSSIDLLDLPPVTE
jgi:hypothetical protein